MNNLIASGNLQLKNLNIGAGPEIIKDYLNIDLSYTPDFIERYKNSTDIGVLKCNVIDSFPRVTNVDVIYSCHFLEHVNLNDGISFLRQCYTALKADGKLRLCVPDFNIWYNAMTTNDSEFFDFYRSNMPYQLSSAYENNFAFFTTMIYGHEHRMTYTFDFLNVLLGDIGFTNVQTKQWGNSSAIPRISELELPTNILRSKESLIVEAVK